VPQYQVAQVIQVTKRYLHPIVTFPKRFPWRTNRNIIVRERVENPLYYSTGEEKFKATLVVKGFQDKSKKFLVHEPNNVRAGSLRKKLKTAG
jgi:hypothetical protein